MQCEYKVQWLKGTLHYASLLSLCLSLHDPPSLQDFSPPTPSLSPLSCRRFIRNNLKVVSDYMAQVGCLCHMTEKQDDGDTRRRLISESIKLVLVPLLNWPV